MKFWHGNRIDREFDMPTADVADQFVTWHRALNPESQQYPLERSLRLWLTSADYFNSVWEAESGPDSFEELFDKVLDLLKLDAEEWAARLNERCQAAARKRDHVGPAEPKRTWRCFDCDWPWPLPGEPPAGSECDNCGGTLAAVVVAEIDTTEGPTFTYSGPDYSVNHVS